MSDNLPQWPQPKDSWEAIGLLIGVLALFSALKEPNSRTMLPPAADRSPAAMTMPGTGSDGNSMPSR